jgi:hypothetical protein
MIANSTKERHADTMCLLTEVQDFMYGIFLMKQLNLNLVKLVNPTTAHNDRGTHYTSSKSKMGSSRTPISSTITCPLPIWEREGGENYRLLFIREESYSFLHSITVNKLDVRAFNLLWKLLES